jgi:hypothetical protein
MIIIKAKLNPMYLTLWCIRGFGQGGGLEVTEAVQDK